MKREELRTPCYVIQKEKLIKNLEILREICQETGCRILLAQKAFSMFAVYPLIGKHLNGAAASGLFEARLAAEELGKEKPYFFACVQRRGNAGDHPSLRSHYPEFTGSGKKI